MARKIQYPTAKSSVITPTMIPATARPWPRSPVSATLRRAVAPSQIPATDPSPPSVRIDRTSDQTAILLMRSAVGGPYSGARVAVSVLDMVVLCSLTRFPVAHCGWPEAMSRPLRRAVEPYTFLYANGRPAVQGCGRGMVSATVSGDDPGAGVEPDTVVAQVRGERLAQAPGRTRRGGGIQPFQYFAGAREAVDPVEGGGHIRTVVDRLMDVGEGDVSESCRLQEFAHGRRIGERERVRPPGGDGHWLSGRREGLMDSDVPLVALVGLPDHHHQAPGRAQRPADVGERGPWVVEEHRAEPAHRQVEALVRKAVGLRVGEVKGDVAQPLGPGEPAGALDGGRGDVDPKCAPRLGRPRGLAGRLPGPAANVEDVVVELDVKGPAQYLVVPSQFGVVAAGARRRFACGVSHRGPFKEAGGAWQES